MRFENFSDHVGKGKVKPHALSTRERLLGFEYAQKSPTTEREQKHTMELLESLQSPIIVESHIQIVTEDSTKKIFGTILSTSEFRESLLNKIQ